MPKCRLKRSASAAVAVTAVLSTGASFAAQTVIEDDYVAVIIEAEDSDEVDERWVLTTPTTGEQENDPDGNHSSGASGNAYLELLPDLRVTHADTPGQNVPPGEEIIYWFWGTPGQGPRATYTANFPEAGRYYTHVRAFSTGSEDNGIHVGINGEWPESGEALQLCTASLREWRWSNRQRDSGGTPCGINNTIWLEVAEAGTHTVMISAREDGFEIDKLMLIKDRSNNTRNCAPQANHPDNITCRNGGIEVADELTDLAVTLESSSDANSIVGDPVEVSAVIKNLDRFDAALASIVEFRLDENDWELVDSDERCDDLVDATLRCVIGDVGPTGPGEGKRIELTLRPMREGTLTIEAHASSDRDDDFENNDTDRLDVIVDAAIVPTDLSVLLGGLPAISEPGVAVPVSVSLSNVGGSEAIDSQLELSISDGLMLAAMPDECEGQSGAFVCDYGLLEAGGIRTIDLSVLAADTGLYSVSASVNAANADDMQAVASVEFQEPDVPNPTDEGGEDTSGGDTGSDGSTGGGEGDGSDTGGGNTGGDTGNGGISLSTAGAIGPLAAGLLMLGAVYRRRLTTAG